ncbi:MAG TPA: tripartite tricarboxylate transporter substrate binding protein [Burkholderiales bacterium]|nr:tripartite tricarboxylate transporter substrate binding protein [Burkholderiales bacterium]
MRKTRAWMIYGVSIMLLLLAPAVHAQTPYPSKPIRFIVGFAPGATNDLVARLLGQKLTEQFGQTVVVENRGGANTAIASAQFVRAAPDGYTLMLNSPGHLTNPSLMKLDFDSVNDFAFITQLAESVNLVIVHPSLPARSIKELIAISKPRPGQINYASSGTGTTVHLSAELFQYMTGVKWVHIPYKGGGLALQELIAGQTSLSFLNLPTAINIARAGKLRALATTGAKRAGAAPELPTVAESGVPGFEVTTMYGISAPAKTPRVIIDRLHGEIVRALNSPDLRGKLIEAGADPVGSTPEEYTAFIKSEIAKWAKVINAAGIKGE